MRRHGSFTIASILLATALSSLGGCGGIGTGNPANPLPSGDPNSGTAARSISTELAHGVCARLIACRPEVPSLCTTEFMKLTNVDVQIGVAPGRYQAYQNIVAAEAKGELVPNPSAVYSCLADVAASPCDDPSIAEGYKLETPSPFSGLADLIPASCQNLFAND